MFKFHFYWCLSYVLRFLIGFNALYFFSRYRLCTGTICLLFCVHDCCRWRNGERWQKPDFCFMAMSAELTYRVNIAARLRHNFAGRLRHSAGVCVQTTSSHSSYLLTQLSQMDWTRHEPLLMSSGFFFQHCVSFPVPDFRYAYWETSSVIVIG